MDRCFLSVPAIPNGHGCGRLLQQRAFNTQLADPHLPPQHRLVYDIDTEFPRTVNPANPLIGGRGKPTLRTVITESWGPCDTVLLEDQVSGAGLERRAWGQVSQPLPLVLTEWM